MRRLVWLMLVAACSSPPPPRPAPPPPPPAPVAAPAPTTDKMSYVSAHGALDQDRVEAKFRKLHPAFERCVAEGSQRVRGLGGSASVAMRIDATGQAHAAYMKHSTLGDRDTEKCILAEVEAAAWPSAVGGEGDAEHTFEVESTVPVAEWKQKRLESARKTIFEKAAKCITPLRGHSWSATIYVRRDGGVAAAGVAPPNAAAESQSDCLVEVLRGFRFGWQRARVSKVTFTIP
jgi:hypothetical protein